MNRRLLTLCVTFALTAGLLTACRNHDSPTPPAPATTLKLQVDAQLAYDLARQQVAIGTRYAGSPGAAKAAAHIADTARTFGYVPTVDTWEQKTPAGTLTFRNVYASLPGKRDGFVILGSHYDTKRLPQLERFDGANDGASSTGLLLAIMKSLKTADPWPGPTIRFAFFDGEEAIEKYTDTDGLYGSRRLAKSLVAAGEVGECRAMVLLDMIGDADLKLTISASDADSLKQLLLKIADEQNVRQHVGLNARGKMIDDHVPFAKLGIPSIDLIDFEYGPNNSYWHTGADTMEHIAPRSLEIVGNLVLQLIQEVPESR